MDGNDNATHDAEHLTPETTLAQAFDAYLKVRKLGQSDETVRNYRNAWAAFAADRRDDLGAEPTLRDLTPETLNAYLAAGMDSGRWGAQSARTYAGSIASVVSALVRAGRLASNPLAGFASPKAPRRAIVYFDGGALRAIFGELERDRTTVNLRLRAVAQIMLDCGARPDEVCGLRFADLDEPGSALLVHGKGGKERRVPVGVYTWRYLADYMSVRPAPREPSEPVFVNARGALGAARADTVSGDMNDLLVRIGLVVPGTPVGDGFELYAMRRTFARRSADGGMDVGELASIMGHSTNSIPMLLERYYTPSDEQKRAAHAAARPADSVHEARTEVRHGSVFAAPRPPSFFERWSPRSTGAGKSPSSRPSSRSRTSGEYRATSRTSSAWATGA
jgi:integrase